MSDGGTAIIRKSGVPARYYSYQADWSHRLVAREPWQSFERIEYVIDGDNGSDANLGTSGSPIATFAEWVRRMPTVIGADHTHKYVGTFRHCTNPYLITPLGKRELNASIEVRVDEADSNAYVQTHAAMAAQAGTTSTSIVVPGTLAANAYIGHQLWVQSGVLGGNVFRRTIFLNDGTHIFPCFPLHDSASHVVQPGDNVKIVRPNVAFDFLKLFTPATGESLDSPVLISGTGNAGPDGLQNSLYQKIGLHFVGCLFKGSASTVGRVFVNNCSLYMWGVEGVQSPSGPDIDMMSFVVDKDYCIGTDDAFGGATSTSIQQELGYDPLAYNGLGAAEIDSVGVNPPAGSMFRINGLGTGRFMAQALAVDTEFAITAAREAKVLSGIVTTKRSSGGLVVAMQVIDVPNFALKSTPVFTGVLPGAYGLSLIRTHAALITSPISCESSAAAIALTDSVALITDCTGGATTGASLSVTRSKVYFINPPTSFGRTPNGQDYVLGTVVTDLDELFEVGRAAVASDGSCIVVGSSGPSNALASMLDYGNGAGLVPPLATGSWVIDVRANVATFTWPAASARTHGLRLFIQGDPSVHALTLFRHGTDRINGSAADLIISSAAFANRWIFAQSDGAGDWWIG